MTGTVYFSGCGGTTSGCKDSGLDLSGNDLAETMIDEVGQILVIR